MKEIYFLKLSGIQFHAKKSALNDGGQEITWNKEIVDTWKEKKKIKKRKRKGKKKEIHPYTAKNNLK